MTNTIEVPISLIQDGGLDAIRELLPKPNLFARRGTHPKYGRGIIFSICPDEAGLIRFAYKNNRFTSGSDWECVYLKDLTLDPVELTTVEDYRNAPEGTVVADEMAVYQKSGGVWLEPGNTGTSRNTQMATSPSTILRWGWGE